jgi:hypothetical protein
MMQLFRGDNIFNKNTEPGIYRNNGLRSKAFGSGHSPDNIELIGLLETIRKHIKPIDKPDTEYYDVTDFLSFSESLNRALYWCKDRGRLILQNANDYYETRYLFTLNIDEKEKISDGIYLFRFNCNPKLKRSDSGQEPHKTILNYENSTEICPLCINKDRAHQILLINSYEYLVCNQIQERYQGALEFSKNDNEWLVLPFDLLGKFRATRIPRADFWTVNHYKVIGEQRPQLNYF